jgi:hypothetical protein
MNRPSTVSQFVRVFVSAAALSAAAMGCGGGSSGSKACTLDEANAIINAPSTKVPYTGCTVINVCHDNQGSAAGLDLVSAGWQTKLVGGNPVAMKGSAMANYSMCVGKGPYLNAGSNPATGLMIDKLDPSKPTPPCGAHMPNLGAMLSPADFECVRSYLTTLTSP